MTKARLITDVSNGYLKKFIVEIDLTDLTEDKSFEDIIRELKHELSWSFGCDLAEIIENK